MEAEDFKKFAKEMIDYITNYLENIRERLVLFLTEKILIFDFFIFVIRVFLSPMTFYGSLRVLDQLQNIIDNNGNSNGR